MSFNLKIAQVCCANAQRDDTKDDYRFGVRQPEYWNLLNTFFDNNVQIVSVKEVRECRNRNDSQRMFPQDIWNDFLTNTKYTSGSLHQVKLTSTEGLPVPYYPFYMGQLYNSKQLCLVNSHCFRFYKEVFGSDNVFPHMGCCIVVGLYAPFTENNVPDLSKQFFVESYHLPLKEEHKNLVCDWILKMFPSKRQNVFGFETTDYTTFRLGDFNIFSDKPDSVKQVESLTTYHYWVNKYLHIDNNNLEPSNVLCNYTFKPFPHDIVRYKNLDNF